MEVEKEPKRVEEALYIDALSCSFLCFDHCSRTGGGDEEELGFQIFDRLILHLEATFFMGAIRIKLPEKLREKEWKCFDLGRGGLKESFDSKGKAYSEQSNGMSLIKKFYLDNRVDSYQI